METEREGAMCTLVPGDNFLPVANSLSVEQVEMQLGLAVFLQEHGAALSSLQLPQELQPSP